MPEPVTSPVSAPEPASLTSEIEEKEESKVNAQGVSVKKIKGPRPHGKTKFKQIAAEEVVIDDSELSENQRRKLEKQR